MNAETTFAEVDNWLIDGATMSLLYKYIADLDALEFILNGACKFTPIPELNDPSELIPNFISEEVVASRDRLRKVGYSDDDLLHLRRQGELLQILAPENKAIDVPRTKEQATSIIRSRFYDDLPRLERLLEEAARTISTRVGLLCLTRRYDSLPMWAHYAANATGLIIGFAEFEKHFSGDKTGVLCQPISIRYEPERSCVTFDPRSHESLFFAKFEEWGYEKEVRVVLPLADCREVISKERRLYLYDVPKDCVRRLILGWKFPSANVQQVRDLMRAHNNKAEIVHARFVRGHVQLSEKSLVD